MSISKKRILVSTLLILFFVLFTILVKVVDVSKVNESYVGFSSINEFVFDTIGVNMIWYDITDWLGLIPVFMIGVYVVIGIIQLLKRKSLLKVDREIIILGMFYILLAGIYVFFEKFVINYRPILIDGALEASYPSSHTFLSLCLCVSSVLVNKKLFSNKYIKFINVFLVCVGIVIVGGRLLSGVHWFSDIIGGIFLSCALLYPFYLLVDNKQFGVSKKNKIEI